MKHQATKAYRIVSKAPFILNISNKMKVSGHSTFQPLHSKGKGTHMDTSLGGPKNQLRQMYAPTRNSASIP